MDNFPHPYTKQDAFDYISMVKAMPGKPMRFAIEVEGKAVGSIGFGSEGDVERVTAEVGYWIGEKYCIQYESRFYACIAKSGVSTGSCFASCCSQEWSFGRFLLFL